MAKLTRLLLRLLNQFLLSFNELRLHTTFSLALEQAESLVDVFRCVHSINHWIAADAVMRKHEPLSYSIESAEQVRV